MSLCYRNIGIHFRNFPSVEAEVDGTLTMYFHVNNPYIRKLTLSGLTRHNVFAKLKNLQELVIDVHRYDLYRDKLDECSC